MPQQRGVAHAAPPDGRARPSSSASREVLGAVHVHDLPDRRRPAIGSPDFAEPGEELAQAAERVGGMPQPAHLSGNDVDAGGHRVARRAADDGDAARRGSS